MSDDGTPVETPADLEAELRSLLVRAHANGIGVEGGWECLNDEASPDWDVVVTQVQRPTSSD